MLAERIARLPAVKAQDRTLLRHAIIGLATSMRQFRESEQGIHSLHRTLTTVASKGFDSDH